MLSAPQAPLPSARTKDKRRGGAAWGCSGMRPVLVGALMCTCDVRGPAAAVPVRVPLGGGRVAGSLGWRLLAGTGCGRCPACTALYMRCGPCRKFRGKLTGSSKATPPAILTAADGGAKKMARALGIRLGPRGTENEGKR